MSYHIILCSGLTYGWSDHQKWVVDAYTEMGAYMADYGM